MGATRRIAPIILVAILAAGQTRFTWEQHSRLTWNDFKGRPRRVAGDLAAETDTGFRTQLTCRGGTLDIDILAEFYPNSSWVKPNKRFPSLLKHEQGHFDITELYVRKMRRAIRDAKVNCENDAKAEAAGKEILRPLDDEWEKAEKQYDAETKDGLDAARQTAASERIASELGALIRHKE